MMKRLVLSFFVAMCALTFGTSVRDARAAAAGKVDVCHVPPGNPAGAMTISVGSQAALNAHLAHGDTQGACNSGPTCQDVCISTFDPSYCFGDPTCEQELLRLLADCLDGSPQFCLDTFDPAGCGGDQACEQDLLTQQAACLAAYTCRP